MKTEEIQRTTRGRDPYEVSQAFQELTPARWSIVDRRGRPVPLSAVGYVLRFGQAYRLRIVSPFHADEIHDVRILNPPSFLRVEPTLIEKDEQGEVIYTMPFKIALDMWGHVRKLGTLVCGDELEVVHYFKPGVYREARPFLCPIVARPRWAVVMVAVLLGLAVMVLEKAAAGLFFPEKSYQDSMHTVVEAFSRGDWWLRFALIAAGLWLAVNLINLTILYQRSRQLRAHFKELYRQGMDA